MKKWTNVIHLPDHDRTWAYLSINVWSIFVLSVVVEIWPCEYWSMARYFDRGRWRRQWHLADNVRYPHSSLIWLQPSFILTAKFQSNGRSFLVTEEIVAAADPKHTFDWQSEPESISALLESLIYSFPFGSLMQALVRRVRSNQYDCTS